MALTAVAIGAALALFAVALENALAALFWPRPALSILMLGAVAGALATLGSAVAPAPIVQRLRRHAAVLLGFAASAAFAALALLPEIGARLLPGPGLGLLSFPPLFQALAVLPFVVVGAVLHARGRDGETLNCGWLLAGAGAGLLLAVVLAGTGLPLRTPWFGGRSLAFSPAGAAAVHLDIDRRLIDDLIAPSPSPPLAFFPKPDASGTVQVLLVGFPAGSLLSSFLERPQTHLTILEEDRALVSEVLARWPALEAARDIGRVTFLHGHPRWWLERLESRFGLIALAPGWSPGAYLSRALAMRADHVWTVESFRSCLRLLSPEGFLLVQRNGVGRVVTTLQAASGLEPRALFSSLVIFGVPGQLTAQLWHSPAWVEKGLSVHSIRRYSRSSGMGVLYRPSSRWRGSFYGHLLQSDRIRGWYFSTPLDLSPLLDERPFFDSPERLVLGPSGPALPEELAPPGSGTLLQAVPSADRDLWGVLLAGLFAAAAIGAAGFYRIRRDTDGGRPDRSRTVAIALGVCSALSLEAFGAWSNWLAPSPRAAQLAMGAMLLGAAAGWLAGRRPVESGTRLAALIALLLVFTLAGYRALPAMKCLGQLASALVVAGAGAILGLALGGAVRRVADDQAARWAGWGEWFAGVTLCAAAVAWVGARLAATHFGYRLIWALAAVAAAAALRGSRRAGTGPRTAPPHENPT